MNVSQELYSVFFNSDAVQPPDGLRRVDAGGERFYWEYITDTKGATDIAFYPSVTTITRATNSMGHGLVKWYASLGYEAAQAASRERAAYGTLYHALCAKYLHSDEFHLNNLGEYYDEFLKIEDCKNYSFQEWVPELQKDLAAFHVFCQEKQFEPIATEVPLRSIIHGFAGCVDLIGTMKFGGKKITALIDIKSGKNGFYPEYAAQLGGYLVLARECFPHLDISGIFNFAPKDWRTAPSYTLKNQTDDPNAVSFMEALWLYKKRHGITKVGQKAVFEFADTITRTGESPAGRNTDLKTQLLHLQEAS